MIEAALLIIAGMIAGAALSIAIVLWLDRSVGPMF